jgi:hypothetical protein
VMPSSWHAPGAESFPAAMSARTACFLETLRRSPVQVYLVGRSFVAPPHDHVRQGYPRGPYPPDPPLPRRRSRPTKYLEHRSQADVWLLLRHGAAVGDGLGFHATTGPRIPAAMIDRTLGDSR